MFAFRIMAWQNDHITNKYGLVRKWNSVNLYLYTYVWNRKKGHLAGKANLYSALYSDPQSLLGSKI